MKSKKVLISCFLVLVFLFQFTSSAFVNAEIGYTTNQEGTFPTDYDEIDGLIRNAKNQPIDYEDAKLSKTVSKGERDGEFYVDLKLRENIKKKILLKIL